MKLKPKPTEYCLDNKGKCIVYRYNKRQPNWIFVFNSI